MDVQVKTVATSFRLPVALINRLRRVTRDRNRWPPGPTQTQIVVQGIELVLRQLETVKRGGRQ